MFTIIGGDGKEYGPATAEQLRGWITAGRANLDTKAKALGTDEWRRLGDFAEFGSPDSPPTLSTAVPGATAPTVAAATPQAASPALPASRLIRLGAALLDTLITAVCVMPGALLLGTTFLNAVIAASRGRTPDLSDINPASALMGAALLGLGLLALFIVQLWMLCTRGQTIAKRLLGIRIVMHGSGAKADFVHVWLLRNFVVGIIRAIPWLGAIFALVDVCFIFGQEQRCVHDYIAGTKVVKA